MTDSSQEKTEQPTEKRKKEARENGQIARSKELSTTVLLMGSAILWLVLGNSLVTKALDVVKLFFDFQVKQLDNGVLIEFVNLGLVTGFKFIAPLIALLFVAVIFGSILVGGFVFATKSIAPNLNKLNPIEGLKKIFSVKSLVELIKAILKFAICSVLAVISYKLFFSKIMYLAEVPIDTAIGQGVHYIIIIFIILASGMLIISAIDIPFQIFDNNQKLKMTVQELKDELKESNGDPELKARISKIQRELANRKIIDRVPDADVIITNPTHFAVALKYDSKTMQAPVLVAKGQDLIALTIIKIARNNTVPIVNLPPLARSIYFNTKLDNPIPADLYIAVAQVLAYIHQLKLFYQGKLANKPQKLKKVKIPEKFKVAEVINE